MKIFQKTLLIAAAAMAFAACSEDFDSTVDPGFIEELEGEKVAMTFGLSVPDMDVFEAAGLPTTKAAAEDESLSVALGAGAATRADYSPARAEELTKESTVHNLWVIQFSGNANTATKQVCKYYSSITNNQVSVDLYNNGTVKTPVYFVANVGADAFKTYETGVSGSKSLSHGDFKKLSLTIPATGYAGTIGDNGLPMLADTLLSAVTGTSTIKLTRTVAKVELILKQDDFDKFQATTAQVCDAPNKFYYVDNKTQLEVKKANYSNGENAFGHFNNVFVSKDFDGEAMKTGTEQRLVFYIPENMRGTNDSSSPEAKNWWSAPLHSSYIEIGGTYTDGSVVTPIEYCIFPGKNNTNDFNIERNTYYTITATIKGANINGDGRVTVAGKAIDLNATNSNKTANCYMVDEATKIYCFDATKMGNGVSVVAKQTVANGKTQDAPGFTATDMKPVKAAVLWEAGPVGFAKELISNVKVDTEEGKVYFSMSGMIGGDCIPGNALIATYDKDGVVLWSWHIWSLNDSTFAPVAYGAKKMMDRNLGAITKREADPNSFGLLYQWGRKDPFVGAYLKDGVVSFAPSSKTDWATDKIAAGDIENATAATEAWKRVLWAVAHPTTFITQYTPKDGKTGNTYDWAGGLIWENQIDGLWGNINADTSVTSGGGNTADATKTMFDPCPIGWKMPPQNIWNNFVSSWDNPPYGSNTPANFKVSNSGANGFANSIGWVFYAQGSNGNPTYYPAAGWRNEGSGDLSGVGTRGLYWSSSSYAAGNVNAGFLDFTSGNVNPLNNGNRASALSVRCVQHLRRESCFFAERGRAERFFRAPCIGALSGTGKYSELSVVSKFLLYLP